MCDYALFFFGVEDEIKSYSMLLQVVVCVQITVGTVTYILDGMRRGSLLQFKFISDYVSGKSLVLCSFTPSFC